jgi:DNA-binding CsgD family transcriptional regulator
MPAVIRELQAIVPASSRGLILADHRCQIDNTYFEGPFVERQGLYMQEFFDGRERQVAWTIAEMLRAQFPTAAAEGFGRVAKVDRETFFSSDYYNEIFKPAGMTQACCVKLKDGGHPRGQITLFRNDREPPFTSREVTILEALHTFVVHGLREGPGEQDFVATDDRALVIVDHDGRPLHLSRDGYRLLLMAFVPRWSPDSASHMRLGMRPELTLLCRRLRAAWSGALPLAPPVLHHRNGWGEFVLRAHWLEAAQPDEESRFIGIVVERHEPRSLGMFRKIEALDLTDREKQLALLFARGQDIPQAARTMGISEHTTISHRRSLYGKLAVDSRLALVQRLQASHAAQSPGASPDDESQRKTVIAFGPDGLQDGGA